jgi:hypothetical protein
MWQLNIAMTVSIAGTLKLLGFSLPTVGTFVYRNYGLERRSNAPLEKGSRPLRSSSFPTVQISIARIFSAGHPSTML